MGKLPLIASITIFMALISIHSKALEVCKQPIWQDEFEGKSLDVTKWNVITGDGCDQNLCGWGNEELQWYSPENLSVLDGMLIITAKSNISGKPYTSAKISSENLFSQKYGRFEARMKLPAERGTWPAFWLMPQHKKELWPVEGEIDILERGGRDTKDMNRILGAIHFGLPWPDNVHYSESLLTPTAWNNEFHDYRVDWLPGQIRWSVDNKVYGEVFADDIKPYDWPFDEQSFYLIINLALGGTLGGVVEPGFEQASLEIDYVRVYSICE